MSNLWSNLTQPVFDVGLAQVYATLRFFGVVQLGQPRFGVYTRYYVCRACVSRACALLLSFSLSLSAIETGWTTLDRLDQAYKTRGFGGPTYVFRLDHVGRKPKYPVILRA